MADVARPGPDADPARLDQCLSGRAHWGLLQEDIRSSVADQSLVDEAYWVLSLSQVVIVVSFCTLPELVLRQISLFMAASKALTLVVTLLVVVVGGDVPALHAWFC